MTRPIRKKVSAKRDITDHFVYLGARDLDVAYRFRAAVNRALDLLAESPNLGAAREFRDKSLRGMRLWPIREFPNFTIFYRPTDRGIDVIRILHASVDYRRVFGP